MVTLAEISPGRASRRSFTEDAALGLVRILFGFDRFIERSVTERDRGTYSFAGVKALGAERDRRFFVFVYTCKTHDPYVVSARTRVCSGGPTNGATGSQSPRAAATPRPGRCLRPHDSRSGRPGRRCSPRSRAMAWTTTRWWSCCRITTGLRRARRNRTRVRGAPGAAPLILRGPRIPSERRIDRPASMVDVTPTLLDLPVCRRHQGQGTSLRAALTDTPTPLPDRPLYFSWLRKDAIGVRHGNWKFLSSADDHELFDLAQDPAERAPQVGTSRARR